MTFVENLSVAWRNHCQCINDGREHFPRDILLLSPTGKSVRKTVDSFEDLFTTCFKSLGKMSLYTSVYCEKCRQAGKFGRIFIDLDGNPVTTLIDMRRIAKDFPNAAIYFTGKGGFAIYINFKPMYLHQPQHTMRRFVNVIEESLDISTIDYHVVGDTMRVSRLPYTVNVKPEANRLCLPINPKWELQYILAQSAKVSQYDSCMMKIDYNSRFDTSALFKIFDKEPLDDMDISRQAEVMIARKNSDKRVANVLQFIEEVAPKVKDGRHDMMVFYIIPNLILSGASDMEVLAICRLFIERSGKEWRDYEHYVSGVYPLTRKRIENHEPVRTNLGHLLVERPELADFFMVKP